jgi:hypothetical protein
MNALHNVILGVAYSYRQPLAEPVAEEPEDAENENEVIAS